MFSSILGLLNFMNEKFQDTWIKVEEPETLNLMIEDYSFTAPEMNIFNALKSLILTDNPWKDPFIFENIVDAFANEVILPYTLTAPHPLKIMTAVHCMNELRPELEFSEKVWRYIAASSIFHSYIQLPDPLRRANEFIDTDINRDYSIVDDTPAGIQFKRYSILKENFAKLVGS